MTVPTVPLKQFCAWRARRAGLRHCQVQRDPGRDLRSTLAISGWMLAPGSSAPYLSLRIRSSGCTREVTDRAVIEDREIVLTTSVRSERHLVPREQALMSIAAKGRRIDTRIRQIGKVVPISRGEVETLAMAISERLHEGPATLADLEEELPTGMLRSFGTEGRRAGVSGVLPVALEYLEEEGRVLLLESGQRLDDGDRVYALTEQVIPGSESAAPDQLDVLPDVLAVYLRSFGPARFEDFVWWAGTTLNRTRTAAASLEVPPVGLCVEGLEGELAVFPDDLEDLLASEVPEEPDVVLLPNRDPFYLGRKVLNAEFLDVDSPEMVLARFRGKPVAGRVLPTILVNGRINGIWEWDPTRQEIQWALLPVADGPMQTDVALEAAIQRQAEWTADIVVRELDATIVLDLQEQGTHWAYGVEEIRSFW